LSGGEDGDEYLRKELARALAEPQDGSNLFSHAQNGSANHGLSSKQEGNPWKDECYDDSRRYNGKKYLLELDGKVEVVSASLHNWTERIIISTPSKVHLACCLRWYP
jgi:hypothetical protein